MSPSEPALFRKGDLLAGKFLVERVIGQGGMGMVLAAYHKHLEKRVAIKVLLPQVCSNAQVVSRFLREGKAAAQLESEHVARVLDVEPSRTDPPTW